MSTWNTLNVIHCFLFGYNTIFVVIADLLMPEVTQNLVPYLSHKLFNFCNFNRFPDSEYLLKFLAQHEFCYE